MTENERKLLLLLADHVWKCVDYDLAAPFVGDLVQKIYKLRCVVETEAAVAPGVTHRQDEFRTRARALCAGAPISHEDANRQRAEAEAVYHSALEMLLACYDGATDADLRLFPDWDVARFVLAARRAREALR